MVKIVECEWASWCERDCDNRQIMQIIKKDGFGSYTIEQPIEENLGNCDYYKVKYEGMFMKHKFKKENSNG